MKNQKLLFWAFVALVFLYLINFRLTSGNSSSGNSSGWTVYGTNGCSWTRKQIDYMKNKKIPHTYVECDKEDCGDISSYPTLKNSSGKILVGFNQI
jgi:hypothetical protein